MTETPTPTYPGRLAPRPTVIVALAALLLAACPQNKPPEVAQAMPAPVKAEAVEIESPLGSYLAGQLARRDNDMDAAAKYFLRTLAEDPDNPDLLHQLLGLVPFAGGTACGRLKSSLAPKKIRSPADSSRIAEAKKTGR